MVKLWFKSGTQTVLQKTGAPTVFDCASCPCGMSCVCTCSSCPAGAPSQWTFTLTGLINGITCSDCNTLNTTFTLDYGTGCVWSAVVDFCGGGPQDIIFQYSGGGWQLIFPASAGSTEYSVADATPDCLVAKSLTFVTTGVACDNWPPTITVSPVGSGSCTTACTECCPDGLPATLTAAFTNGATPICACLAGVTVTLTYAGSNQWSGTVAACGHTVRVLIICNPAAGCGNFDLAIQCDGVTIFGPMPVDGGCDCTLPFLQWANQTMGGTCGTCTPATDFTMTVSA